VSREVRSLPLIEKAAPGKRPPAAAAAAAAPAPVSTVDAYQKMLSSIPEFSGFGRLFKVCILFCLLKFDKCIC
jgi:coatomer protein complex subunit gamma